MKLKIKRSQKSSMMGSAVFCLDIMVELSRDEADLIRKYKLERQVVYASRELATGPMGNAVQEIRELGSTILDRMLKRTLLVKDLVEGQHIECKDLAELLATEQQVHEGCTNLARYLVIAQRFDGSEEIVPIAA